MATISTTGQLRQFLANMLIGVKDGDIKEAEARSMVRLASQINESFYAEIKTNNIRLQMGGDKFPPIGDLPIGGGK